MAVLLILIPVLLAWILAAQERPLQPDQVRGLLIAPLIIFYIVLIAPWMDRVEVGVVQSLRPAILLDDEHYYRLVSKYTHIPLYIELIAIGIGILIGILTITWNPDMEFSFFDVYWMLSTVLMYVVLSLTIVSSLVSTRFTPLLLRQPTHVDPFDITPFEAIGRQSLLAALVFIGGITLSLLLSSFQPGILYRWEFWLIYGPMILVPIAIFFLTLQPTHRVLAAAKAREQAVVKKKINQTSREMVECLSREAEAARKAQIINALSVYEQRLNNARTWPYNTSILRTLFFSVLVPAGTLIGRILLNIFIPD